MRNLSFLAILAALIIGAAALAYGSSGSTQAGTPDISTVGVDMDVTGNALGACASEGCAPGTIGNGIQTCNTGATLAIGGTLDVDIVVNAVPGPTGTAPSGAGPNLQGFDIDLHYDPSIVHVTGKSTTLSILYAGAGSVPFSGTNGTPDTDGDFSIGEVDNGPIGERGPGVLIRLTLTGIANGTSDLTLDYVLGGAPDPNIYDHSGSQNIYTIGSNLVSKVRVGTGSCNTPTPTPTPSPTPSPTPTPSPSPTPSPPPNSMQFTANKNFVPDSSATVSITLTCDGGATVDGTLGNNSKSASEASPAVFTVGSISGPVNCSATEPSPPSGVHDVSQTGCANIAVTAGNNYSGCTITNNQRQTTITVNKDFSPDSTATATINYTCTSGTPISGAGPATEASAFQVTIVGYSAGATCTVSETAIFGYTTSDDCADPISLADSTSGTVSCTFTNTQTLATVHVNKDFADNATIAVTISLSCGSGTVTTDDGDATEIPPDSADFTVRGLDVNGTSCNATETVPSGYVETTGCHNIPTNNGQSDTCSSIVNTPTSATFTVNKVFTADAPEVPITVHVTCTSGTPSPASGPASPSTPFQTTVTKFNATGSTCTATEDVPVGYSEVDNCASVPMTNGGTPSCTITNSRTVHFHVKKHTDVVSSAVFHISLTCSAPASVVATDDTATNTDSADFDVSGFTNGTTCTAHEAVPQNWVSNESNCQNVLLTPDGFCTINNTYTPGAPSSTPSPVPSGTPTPTPTPSPTPSPTPTPGPPTNSPSPTPIGGPPTPRPTRTPEGGPQTTTPTATPTNTPTPTPSPTPSPTPGTVTPTPSGPLKTPRVTRTPAASGFTALARLASFW
jgi:hypothetical protein